jgi:alginate O-acetyltransferase complex protein AlgI
VLFNSLVFLYLFLGPTYLVFWLLRTRTQRHVWLTLTGYVFYGYWNWKFCFLMAFSTLVSYLAGLGFLAFEDARRRKLCLVVPIAIDLGLLGFFKYTNFALESLGALAGWLHLPWRAAALDIVLPVGISFYTFHTITYVVDCYRRTIEPTRNFWEFSCYVSLFSQLVAGPIVRFRQVDADLENLGRAERTRWLDRGWSFFVIGLIQKVLVADTLAAVIDPALEHHRELSTGGAWACLLGYAYQLYFDFAGYSNMAVGLGYMFGIRIPQNFDSPYQALDIADFWRRWHISLSSCLKDYLYIPLGGNRGGPAARYRNLMLTMLIGGLWHGASWNFVIWGGYHGALLVGHGLTRTGWERLPAPLRRLVTFLLVVIGWVFFRSTTLAMSMDLLGTMFGAHSAPLLAGGALSGWVGLSVMLVIAAVVAHLTPNTFQMQHRWGPLPLAGLTVLFVMCLVVITGGRPTPFLYFQF